MRSIHGFLTTWAALIALTTLAATPPTTAELAYSEAKNFLVNPAMELAGGSIEKSGGTLAISSTSGKYRTGKGFQWDSSSASQTLTIKAKQAEVGLSGEPGLGYVYLKCTTGTCTHKLQAYDGTNVLGEQVITSSTAGFVKNLVSFTYPSSGRVDLRLISVASNEPEVSGDDAFIGVDSRILTITQAKLVGSLKYAATTSCAWSKSSTGTFSADTDCPTPSVTGDASAPSTKVPGIRFASGLPKGEYLFLMSGGFYCDRASSSCEATYNLTDGTNALPLGITYGLGSGTSNFQGATNVYQGRLNLSSAIGDSTFQVNVNSLSASTSLNIYAATGDFTINVYRFPTSEETGLRVDQLGWHVDANISGANPSLGTADVASYTGIENGSLTLTNNTGNGVLTAQIPCSSTNAPSGTTCSAGNESVGVSFNLPSAGDVIACASFAHNMDTASGAQLQTAFQLVETPTNAQTISQEGKSRITSEARSGGGSTTLPLRVCGTFTFASAGQKVLRLFYEQDNISGTVNANVVYGDAAAAVGQRDIHWEVYPINYLSGALPRFSGLVTSNTTGQERIERARLICSASASIAGQSGTWISSIANKSGNSCVVTIATGIFSALQSCSITDASGGGRIVYHDAASTTTSIQPACVTDSFGVVASCTFDIICMGPR